MRSRASRTTIFRFKKVPCKTHGVFQVRWESRSFDSSTSCLFHGFWPPRLGGFSFRAFFRFSPFPGASHAQIQSDARRRNPADSPKHPSPIRLSHFNGLRLAGRLLGYERVLPGPALRTGHNVATFPGFANLGAIFQRKQRKTHQTVAIDAHGGLEPRSVSHFSVHWINRGVLWAPRVRQPSSMM
jgi:hypothetical protein